MSGTPEMSRRVHSSGSSSSSSSAGSSGLGPATGGDFGDARVGERGAGGDGEGVEDGAVGVEDEGVALEEPAGLAALNAELGHVERGAGAVARGARGGAALAAGGGGEGRGPARRRAEQTPLERLAELHPEALAASALVRGVRARAELHRTLQPTVVGILAGGVPMSALTATITSVAPRRRRALPLA